MQNQRILKEINSTCVRKNSERWPVAHSAALTSMIFLYIWINTVLAKNYTSKYTSAVSYLHTFFAVNHRS
jgi:hypothetical protein